MFRESGGKGREEKRSQYDLEIIFECIMERINEMNTKMTMVYWKEEKFWLGKLLEHPEVMTQGNTLDELEKNIKDAYLMMAMEDVPQEHNLKEILI